MTMGKRFLLFVSESFKSIEWIPLQFVVRNSPRPQNKTKNKRILILEIEVLKVMMYFDEMYQVVSVLYI